LLAGAARDIAPTSQHSSGGPAALKAFLVRYPKGKAAQHPRTGEGKLQMQPVQTQRSGVAIYTEPTWRNIAAEKRTAP
jgi:hypothetical protein